MLIPKNERKTLLDVVGVAAAAGAVDGVVGGVVGGVGGDVVGRVEDEVEIGRTAGCSRAGAARARLCGAPSAGRTRPGCLAGAAVPEGRR